jgi:UDP-glucuronate 4-epimerase
MAHAFSAVAGLPATGLRFFTVYGPWGRPDMAPILFARAILGGQPIRLFNQGRMLRDFTYVDDVVEAIVRVLSRPPVAAEGRPPHRVLNVGSSRSVELGTFVRTLELLLGRTAMRLYAPMQPGDVPATCASTAAREALTGFVPRTPLDEGFRRMADWLVDWDRPAARTVRPAVDEVLS